MKKLSYLVVLLIALFVIPFGVFADEAADTTATEEPVEDSSTPVAQPATAKIQDDIKSVLVYMDQLLENLPEDKIEEFAKSEHFDTAQLI